MNRWARIIFGIGALGFAGWLAVGVQGVRVGAAAEPLALHALLALVATLAIVLAELWVAFFLAACARAASALHGRADGRVQALRRDARRMAAVGLAAAASALAFFALSSALYPRRLTVALHLATALAAAALQVAFLVGARGALRRQRGEFADLAASDRADDAAAAAC